MKFFTISVLMAGLFFANQPAYAGWQDKASTVLSTLSKIADQSSDYLLNKITHNPQLTLVSATGTIAAISLIKYIKKTSTPSNNTIKAPSIEDSAYNIEVLAETKEVIKKIHDTIDQLLNGETTTNLSPKFESKHSYYKALITQRSNNMCDYQLWRVDKKTNQIFNIREQLNGTIVEHRFG